MLRAILVAGVIAVALLQGGTLRNFAGLELRRAWLVVASLALQLLIFPPIAGVPSLGAAVPLLYVVSMAMLVVWAVLNPQLPGIWLMTGGLLMNTAAIVANGGYMPVSPLAAALAGRGGHYAGEAARSNNSIATDTAQLWILTDILAVPDWVPFANVFSIGDVMLTAGIAWLCYRTTRGGPHLQRQTA